jgi:pyrroline-5-carboxylate reductase
MSITLKGTLVLAGCGKMGGAMLEGWLKAGADPKKIAAIDPKPPQEVVDLLHKHSIRHNPPIASITDTEVIVVAVKPQVMDEVLPNLVPLKSSKPLILSVAAGKTIATFAKYFGADASIIRTIPNTPAAIGRGITAMCANAPTTNHAQKKPDEHVINLLRRHAGLGTKPKRCIGNQPLHIPGGKQQSGDIAKAIPFYRE